MKLLRPTLVPAIALAMCFSGCVELQVSGSYHPPEEAEVSIVEEASVPAIAVSEYYFVGGRYYYWHPGMGRYVVIRGRPPAGYRVSHLARLEPRNRAGHPVAEPHKMAANEHPAAKPAPGKPVPPKPDPQKKPAPAKKPQDKDKPKQADQKPQ